MVIILLPCNEKTILVVFKYVTANTVRYCRGLVWVSKLSLPVQDLTRREKETNGLIELN
jgi:hypothetical protein